MSVCLCTATHQCPLESFNRLTNDAVAVNFTDLVANVQRSWSISDIYYQITTSSLKLANSEPLIINSNWCSQATTMTAEYCATLCSHIICSNCCQSQVIQTVKSEMSEKLKV